MDKKYQWNNRLEMVHAARALAYREISENKGNRNVKIERKLYKFAEDENQRKEIALILATARHEIQKEARNNPRLWNGDKPPTIETELQMLSRLRKKRALMLSLLLVFIALVVSLMALNGDTTSATQQYSVTHTES